MYVLFLTKNVHENVLPTKNEIKFRWKNDRQKERRKKSEAYKVWVYRITTAPTAQIIKNGWEWFHWWADMVFPPPPPL
jgi:hypothetical protein